MSVTGRKWILKLADESLVPRGIGRQPVLVAKLSAKLSAKLQDQKVTSTDAIIDTVTEYAPNFHGAKY